MIELEKKLCTLSSKPPLYFEINEKFARLNAKFTELTAK